MYYLTTDRGGRVGPYYSQTVADHAASTFNKYERRSSRTPRTYAVVKAAPNPSTSSEEMWKLIEGEARDRVEKAAGQLTIEQAISEVLGENPDLYERFTRAKKVEAGVATAPGVRTLRAAAWDAISARAQSLRAKNEKLTSEQSVAQTLTTSDGKRLYTLYNHHQSLLPAAEALAKIRRDGDAEMITALSLLS
jgi:hypothetical protein